MPAVRGGSEDGSRVLLSVDGWQERSDASIYAPLQLVLGGKSILTAGVLLKHEAQVVESPDLSCVEINDGENPRHLIWYPIGRDSRASCRLG
jgi:hypothetical protein